MIIGFLMARQALIELCLRDQRSSRGRMVMFNFLIAFKNAALSLFLESIPEKESVISFPMPPILLFGLNSLRGSETSKLKEISPPIKSVVDWKKKLPKIIFHSLKLINCLCIVYVCAFIHAYTYIIVYWPF